MKTVNNSNNFSFRRFARLVSVGFSSPEFRVSLLASFITAIVYLTITLFMRDGDGASYFSDKVYDIFCDFGNLLFIVTTIGFSVVACSLASTGARVSSLMIPARRAEKFLARVSVVLLGSAVAFTIIMAVMCGAFALLSVALDPSGSLAQEELLKGFVGTHYISNWAIAQVSIVLACFSMFLLGGVLWKGPSWPITMVCLIIICITIAGVADAAVPDNANVDRADINVAVGAACCAATVLFTWAAYRLFARMQAVKPKLAIRFRINRRASR